MSLHCGKKISLLLEGLSYQFALPIPAIVSVYFTIHFSFFCFPNADNSCKLGSITWSTEAVGANEGCSRCALLPLSLAAQEAVLQEKYCDINSPWSSQMFKLINHNMALNYTWPHNGHHHGGINFTLPYYLIKDARLLLARTQPPLFPLSSMRGRVSRSLRISAD